MFLGGKFGKSNRTFPFIRFFFHFRRFSAFLCTYRSIDLVCKQIKRWFIATASRYRYFITAKGKINGEFVIFFVWRCARHTGLETRSADRKWNNCTAIPNKNYPNHQSLRDMISHDDFLFHRKLFISVYTHNRFDSKKNSNNNKKKKQKKKKKFFPSNIENPVKSLSPFAIRI